VVKFEAIELVLQPMDFLVIRGHLGVVVALVFHNLVDDELRVTSDIQTSDAQLDGDAQAINKHLILRHIVRSREVKADHISHAYPEQRDED
jgi:hypothetical protein